MVPYFGVLLVLSVYGLHRYAMIRGYWKHRGQMLHEAPQRFAELPRITVQLPIYNEQYVVEAFARRDCQNALIRAHCSRSRCWTIPLTKPNRSPSVCVPSTRTQASRSNISIAPTATVSKPELWNMGWKPRPAKSSRSLTRTFYRPSTFWSATVHFFRRREGRHGADALGLSEPRLQRAHRSASHAAGRPFRAGACSSLRRRQVLQLQLGP